MGTVKRYVKKQARRAGGFLKKRYTTGGRVNVGRIVKDVAILKNAINVEHKYADVLHAPNVFQGTPYVFSLVGAIAQGDGNTQRQGTSLKINFFQMKARIERAANLIGSGNVNAIRCMLVLDKEPLVGTLTVTQLLSYSNTMSLRNFDYATSGRYKVLVDKTYVIDGVKTNTIDLNWFRKMETKVRYAQGDGSVLDNNLYLVVIADGNTSELVTQFQTRIKYVDN